MNAPLRDKPARGGNGRASLDRGGFFRLCRMLHAYLSAFAFLALILFSATGILLNHPEWFENDRPAERTVAVQLSPAEIAAARATREPGQALAAAVQAKAPLVGAYASADLEGSEALIRFAGPKGTTDLNLDLATGKGEAKVAKASAASLIQDLHRGKNSGAAWRFVIDASGWLVLALSLIGYVLFFSLRFRLRTSLILTGVSLLGLVAVVWLLVP